MPRSCDPSVPGETAARMARCSSGASTSSMSDATCAPMAIASGRRLVPDSGSGSSTSMARSMSAAARLCPDVLGMRFTCATTVFACFAAASAQSTETPSEHWPCSSGGVTCRNAASSGSGPPGSEERGISLRNTGVVGAALLDRLADVRADEERVMSETALHLRLGIGRGSRSCACGRLRRCEGLPQRHHSIDEHVRGGRTTMDVQPGRRSFTRRRLRLGQRFAWVQHRRASGRGTTAHG
jgi:hypothetical protein